VKIEVKTMRRFKYLIPLLLLVLFQSALAVDTFYDSTVTVIDVPGKTIYHGTCTFDSSASGDIYYTQGVYIGGLNQNNAFGYFICSEVGVEDVNVFFEYSNDLTNWIVGTTNSGLDAVGTTAKSDTIDVIAGAQDVLYKNNVWMRIKFVAGQDIGETQVTYSVGFDKPGNDIKRKYGTVRNKK
jgi:hypothetical protein